MTRFHEPNPDGGNQAAYDRHHLGRPVVDVRVAGPRRDIQTAVGRRIKATRCALGWTVPQLADKVAVSRPCIDAWETGRRNMPAWRLDQIATALGVSAAELLREGQ